MTCEIALRSPEPDDRVIDGQSILLLNTPLNRLMMRSQSSGARATAKNDGSSRQPSNIRARSTRDCAIDISFAISASLIDNSIAPAMPS